MDWLKPLLLLFYAPARGMAEARDRAPLGPAVLLAFAGQVALLLYLFWPHMFTGGFDWQHSGALFSLVRRAAESVLIVAVGYIPTTIFVANLLERRGSFGVALAQEYASIASAVFYARAAATLVGLVLAILSRVGGFEALFFAEIKRTYESQAQSGVISPEQLAQLVSSAFMLENWSYLLTHRSPN